MQFRRDFKRHPSIAFRYALSAPFIYAMVAPLVFLDVVIELYHRVCFPLYGLPYVQRRKYIRIDRHRLKYLNAWEKLNCAYCGYANGLLPYAAAIAAATERYWCGIMHQKHEGFTPQPHQATFLPYGDEAALDRFVNSNDEVPTPEIRVSG